ncbi:hypothetical protein [Neorhizobium sp. S3-V5DH]|uniref:hypothetical protein n=1 Tax=Neorhizobium sp. S3-V5DH TaxID=2485166 RepID=UPI0010EBD4DF|nr:hypothetical protein [Neorhizobium sp. S3-V5DH]TCV67441.1 hypothetical protein EDE09_113100 [Neorhizobium sp. S3-V5DH]
MFLQTMQDKGVWKPKNNGVLIVQEQIAYNQTISKCLQQALPKSKFELAGITDIQYPVQGWGLIIQDIKKIGAGCCRAFAASPAACRVEASARQGESFQVWLNIAAAE